MIMNAAKICVEDIEELNYSVHPWELRMSQLSNGAFTGTMEVTQVGDILISREFWSKKIVAQGGSPPGFLLLAGPCIGEGFGWCGSRTDHTNLAYSAGSTEVDFITPDSERHWTILVPLDVINSNLGDDTTDSLLPNAHVLSSCSVFTRDLYATIIRILAASQKENVEQMSAEMVSQARDQLLSAVTSVLLCCSQSKTDKGNESMRFLAYQRARSYAEGLEAPISVHNLAEKVGTSRRTLELGFSEAIGISPQSFLRNLRLNGLHRDLTAASRKMMTVTSAAEKWGFTELGRAAGYYRNLFGACPSETLQRNNQLHSLRFSDVLRSS